MQPRVHSTVYTLAPLDVPYTFFKGPSIKDVIIFLAAFVTPLPHLGILTLIYLVSTF